MDLKTERLWLRSPQASDTSALIALWTDPEVTHHLGGPRDPAKLRERIAADLATSSPPKFDLWSLVERSSGEVIGDCGLKAKEVDGQAEIELVYVLARRAWGRGYATEIGIALREFARSDLSLPRLIALIEPEHAASARVAEKAGFVLEKTTTRPGGRIMRVYAIQLKDASSLP